MFEKNLTQLTDNQRNSQELSCLKYGLAAFGSS